MWVRRNAEAAMRLGAIGFVLTLALGIFVAPLAGDAQQPAKVPRIGFLLPGTLPATVSPANEPFRQALRDLGYVEGQNITLELRWAEGKLERLPDLAAELVRLKMDVIVAASTPAALAAKRATTGQKTRALSVRPPSFFRAEGRATT